MVSSPLRGLRAGSSRLQVPLRSSGQVFVASSPRAWQSLSPWAFPWFPTLLSPFPNMFSGSFKSPRPFPWELRLPFVFAPRSSRLSLSSFTLALFLVPLLQLSFNGLYLPFIASNSLQLSLLCLPSTTLLWRLNIEHEQIYLVTNDISSKKI